MIARRGFLRTLAGLPLVGGSIALIGAPTAAAVPITDELHFRYLGWLATEFGHALIERDGRSAAPEWRDFAMERRCEWCSENLTLNPFQTHDRFGQIPTTMPSTRAAVILSAAGVPLLGGRDA